MLTQRSQEKELIDLGPDYYTQLEYIDCLKKLFKVNKLFGVFRTTTNLLKSFPNDATVLDIGCGGGLFLLHLSKHFPKMKMTGLDISVTAINEAKSTLKQWQSKQLAHHVAFQLQQQPELASEKNSVDILLATFVCHHLTDEELVNFLRQAYHNARQVVVINEVHRHPVAKWLYRCLSPFLFRNRLITHDGVISIQRGFTRAEWTLLLQKANIQHYEIKWCFPFRWSIILGKNPIKSL